MPPVDKKPLLAGAIVNDTFQNLVRQFSQELCFFRELIQNALDAGTNRVDVWLDYDAPRGLAVAHVQDFGEGMDRSVIDTQLTRLFASSKEDDFTKIGKFGIGFVSVFAIGPEAVVVDTGKNGESWRVIFKPDGQFDRVRPEQPFEGTHVQVYKRMPVADFRKLQSRAKETVQYWCRHSAVDICFDGQRVNQPFDVDCPVKVHFEEQGTEIVAGLSRQAGVTAGFYNGGITLLEAWSLSVKDGLSLDRKDLELLDHVCFKIKSRYLEHTLTRDNVKQDRNFDKAMGILRTVVTEQLIPAMYDALEAALARSRTDWAALLPACQRQLERTLLSVGRTRPCLPRVGGGAVSFADLARVRAESTDFLAWLGVPHPQPVVFFDHTVSSVTMALDEEDVPVLESTADGPLMEGLHRQLGTLVQATGWLDFLEDVGPESVPENLQRLLAATTRLLAHAGLHYASTGFGRWRVADSPCIIHHGESPLFRPAQTHSGHRHLRLSIGHPVVVRLATVAATDESAAAYLMARTVCMDQPTLIASLMAAVLDVTGG